MNKKTVILIILVLIAAPVGYLLLNNKSLENSMESNAPVIENSQDTSMETTEDVDTMIKTEDENAMMKAPEGALTYMLTQPSTASYTAQKRFLEKEDAVVVGTTDNLNGEGWFDLANQDMYLNAQIDLGILKSDSEKRDEDVLKMFNTTLATLVLNSVEGEIMLDTPFDTTANVTLTVNGVAKEVTFNVTGTVTETGFTATGNGMVNISDFNITPPSMLEVFTVDDGIELTFDVTGKAKAQ